MANFQFDNTLKVQEEANDRMAEVLEMDSKIAPISRWPQRDQTLAPKRMGYHINGPKGIIDEIDYPGNTCFMNGRWQRLEEIKSTPWTKAESELYYAHRTAESQRVRAEEKAFFDKKNALKKLRGF